MNEEREHTLKALLHKDGLPPEQVQQLMPLLSQLQEMDAVTPTAVETHKLINTLLPELPAPSRWRQWHRTLIESWIWLLAKAQLRVVQQEILGCFRHCDGHWAPHFPYLADRLTHHWLALYPHGPGSGRSGYCRLVHIITTSKRAGNGNGRFLPAYFYSSVCCLSLAMISV